VNQFKILLCALICILLTACPDQTTLNLSVAPLETITTPGGVQSITATWNGSGTLQWSLVGLGQLTNDSNTGVTYTAPNNVSAQIVARVTATSVDNPNLSATTNITVNPVVNAITITATSEMVRSGRSLELNATVTGSGNTDLNWRIASGIGVLSTEHGAAVQFTAPLIRESSFTIIEATSALDATKKGTYKINVQSFVNTSSEARITVWSFALTVRYPPGGTTSVGNLVTAAIAIEPQQ
jgi:hypothetical protein